MLVVRVFAQATYKAIHPQKKTISGPVMTRSRLIWGSGTDRGSSSVFFINHLKHLHPCTWGSRK
jgi:hypothetical protein